VKKLFAPLCAILLLGCARTYFRQISPVLHELSGENYEAALAELDGRLEEGTFLYHAEKGTILSYAERYEESNVEFDRAETIREDLYTRSISKEVASLLLSDRTKDYRGEDFEDVLLNYFMTMNYLALEEFEDALVECRKLNHKLVVLNDMYEQKNTYGSDAFAEYLTGAVYDSDGDCDDAFISYRASVEAYDDYETQYGTPRPSFLRTDLIRAADLCHFGDDVALWRERFGLTGELGLDPDEGEVLFIFENGMIPAKDEVFMDVPIPDGEGYYMARMAFATYETFPPTVAYGDLQASGRTVRTELVEDIQAIAATNVEDRRGREIARTIARGAAKYLAYKGVKEGVEAAVKDEEKEEDKGAEVAGEVAGAIVNIIGLATEQADTRSWLSLPQEIQAARFGLPEGLHDLEIDFYDRSGARVERVLYEGVRIWAGRITFLRHRIF
jgi:hypothetical protein